ncbi:AAA family ATPase [Proteus vulgaris]|uniref:AAA family ATPase n=1 Tax=Proteus vulgaris TaxID=585 RepID=UPI0006590B38|nr:AAA family ATPase [Proteus vulgaris]CRL60719.1 Chromatin associated protein KTI12 [Proteus vulgaris]
MFTPQEVDQHTQSLIQLIANADQAITDENFEYLMNFYTENGTLVVKDDLHVSGKTSLKKAFMAIAGFFNHSLQVSQGKVKVIFGEDCALVLAQTLLSANMPNEGKFNTVREATYVFKFINDQWLCVIDNSYGTDLLKPSPNVRLHFFCGKIASGKSTLAKSLSKSPKTVLINEDEWLSQLYPNQIKTVTDYIEKSELIKGLLSKYIATLLSAGNTVIMDFPANTPKQRQWLKSLADNANMPYLFHVLKVENTECKKRLSLRNQSDENPFKTTNEEFDFITEHFSYPDAKEQLVIKEYQ